MITNSKKKLLELVHNNQNDISKESSTEKDINDRMKKIESKIKSSKEFNSEIINHILFLHYSTIVALKPKEQSSFIACFYSWYDKDNSFVKSNFKRKIADFFGMKALIKLNTLISKF